MIDLFGGPIWTKNWSSRAPIPHTTEILAMNMWSNTDVKPLRTFWESDQSVTHLEDQNGPKF